MLLSNKNKKWIFLSSNDQLKISPFSTRILLRKSNKDFTKVYIFNFVEMHIIQFLFPSMDLILINNKFETVKSLKIIAPKLQMKSIFPLAFENIIKIRLTLTYRVSDIAFATMLKLLLPIFIVTIFQTSKWQILWKERRVQR